MTKYKTLLISLLLAWGASGCSTLVETAYQRPDVQMPAHWAQSPAEQPAVAHPRWWTDFGDEALNALVDQALARNNDLAAAALKVRSARLAAELAGSDLRPSVSGQLGSSREKSLHDDSAMSRSHSATLGISYELDLWGRLSLQRDALAWEAAATEQDRESTRISLIASTATLYWKLAYLNQRLQLSADSITYARRTLTLVQAQHAAGAASQLDVLNAEQSLVAQQASEHELQQQQVEARNALAILLDGPPGRSFAEREALPESELPAVGADLPAALLGRRPDLRAAELRLREQLASADAVRASYYPRFSLTGSLGSVSTSLGQVLSNPVAALGVGLELPFLNLEERRLSIAQADTSYESAVLDFRQTLYTALAETENALSSRRQLLLQGDKLEQSLQLARRSEALTEVRYRAGASSLKDWLDAQQTRREAEVTRAANRYDAFIAQLTLYQALGGGAAGG